MSVEYTDAQLELFNQAMGIMKKELPSASYMTFFKPLKLRAVTPDALIIEGPDDFTLKNIRNRYMTMLYNVMKITFGRSYELTLATKEDLDRQSAQISRTMLNKKYTFDNFIVGESNRFACAAALAVAEDGPEGAITRCLSMAAWAWAKPT